MNSSLFTPLQLGPMTLANRFVMPALTRSRAGEGDVPTLLHARYYAQRAGAGLIVTEGAQVSPQGKGYLRTPGIYSPEQTAGWRLVTDAVHAKRGHIYLQLWHVGRMSHRDLQPDHALPVAPSAILPEGHCYTQNGLVPLETPRELTAAEIDGIVGDFGAACWNAVSAGFDGVELHGANGYLPDQFLRTKANRRTDEYGGSIENRARFMLELVDVMIEVWGPERVGVRVSPENRMNDISDSNPQPLFDYVATQLSRRSVGYLSVIEGDMTGQSERSFDYGALRRGFNGRYIANNGYDMDRALEAIDQNRADLVAFGRPFLANPDLVERFRVGAPLNTPDTATFYGGEAEGYLDYPEW